MHFESGFPFTMSRQGKASCQSARKAGDTRKFIKPAGQGNPCVMGFKERHCEGESQDNDDEQKKRAFMPEKLGEAWVFYLD